MSSEEQNLDNQPAANENPPKGSPLPLILSVVACVVLLLVIGFIPRLRGHAETPAAAHTEANSRPQVDVVAVEASAPFDEVEFPANIQALDQTAVVARASGYVEKWLADIGDHVTAGQTLAIIDTPDLDQQLLQARDELTSAEAAFVQMNANVSSLHAKLSEAVANLARAQASVEQAKTDLERARVGVSHGKEAVARQQAEVAQAKANLDLAQVTSTRYQGMLADGSVDRESADQAAASYKTNQANVDAVQAALRAAQEDVYADSDAVLSAQANVQAYSSAVQSSRADVQAAESNIEAGSATVSSAAANVRENQANVARLAVLQSFQKVTAPFSGVITARNIDTGSLISAAGSSGSAGSSVGSSIAGSSSAGNAASGSSLGGSSGSAGGSSLYSIADLDKVRVYVNVPQVDENEVRVGQSAAVTVSNLSNRTFRGTITRTADALDPVSRTLVTEVELDNPKGILRPGMFAQVHFRFPHPVGSVLIPDAALVTNALGSQVEVVQPQGTIHFQPILVGRDFGKTMEVMSGLQPGQKIIASSDDSMREGEAVTVANVEQVQPEGQPQ